MQPSPYVPSTPEALTSASAINSTPPLAGTSAGADQIESLGGIPVGGSLGLVLVAGAYTRDFSTISGSCQVGRLQGITGLEGANQTNQT